MLSGKIELSATIILWLLLGLTIFPENPALINDLKNMNSQILIKINSFVKNRLIEFTGILITVIALFLLISIASYSPSDPNFIYTPENANIKNFGGFYGSVISDFLLQSIGLISFFVVLNLLNWGFALISDKKIINFIPKVFYTLAYIIFGTTFINIILNDFCVWYFLNKRKINP